ncbi:hypothetical protein ABPG72_020443 [Tetrahymena utriculariae]
MEYNQQFTTPKKSQRTQRDENVMVNDELEYDGGDLRRQQSELRGKIEDRQHMLQLQKVNQSQANQTFRFLQIVNIFFSLLFGIGCLTLYPEIHLINKKVFYLVIFYMAISILCFFFSLIIMIIFWFGSKIFGKNQTQQHNQNPPSHQNTNRNNIVNNDVEMYNSQLNRNNVNYSSTTNLINANNYNNYNSNNAQQLNQSMESEHSVIAFRTVNNNLDQVPWCNVGWFPLVYFSTLYIAYFVYLILSTSLIVETWKKIPLLVSIFLIYIYIVGVLHVVMALTLLFTKKFISRHIEEMEEAEVYKVDDEEIQRRKQEILDARNRDIQKTLRNK